MDMLDRETDEALFWAYELFYSKDFINGENIDTSTFEYICDLYKQFYQILNPDIEYWITGKLSSSDPAITIGSFIYTLINRQYRVDEFIDTFLHIKCMDRLVQPDKIQKHLRIILRPTDIIKYDTINGDPKITLKQACRFAIRKNVTVLFNTFIPGSLIELWRNHWLYYAARSPIWAHRISSFDGFINHDMLAVEFDDEYYDENDLTELEAFYNKWNYEPDEQGIEMRNRIIGSDDSVQINVQTFCKKYGATIPTRKLKIRS
jgi:hypothetical protein